MTNEEFEKITEQHERWLAGLPNGKKAVLRDEDLSGVKINGVDLSRADLQGANLSHAFLTNMQFVGTNFHGADLHNVIFREVNLSEADLSETDMHRAELYHSKLHNVNLSEADLTRANLFKSDLSKADLRAANLCAAYLIGVELTGAALSYVNLRGAEFSDMDLSDVDFTHADLRGTNLDETLFYNDEHKAAYDDICGKMKYLDCYHRSVAYLFALDSECREHIDDIFAFKDDGIKREGLHCAWQTGTSKRTTRLAFNLWNGCCSDDDETYKDSAGNEHSLPSCNYTPEQIFCYDTNYVPYYFEAIRIRFEMV